MDEHSLPQPSKYLGWKTLGGYVVLLAAVTVAYTLWAVGLRFVSLRLNIAQSISSTLNRLGGIAICIGATALTSRLVLNRSLGNLAFQRHRGWWGDLFFGASLSTVSTAALFAIFNGNRWLTTQSWRWQTLSFGVWSGVLWNSILVNAYAAIGEEVIFCGYMLSGLKEAWGEAIGLAVMSVIFASQHLVVSTAGQIPIPLFVLSLLGPGLLLGWAYLRTGSLWLPIGIHFMWNLVQDDLLNLPGRTSLETVFGMQTHSQGPLWLVGSAYGIETGLLSMVPLGIGFAGVWLWTGNRRPVTHERLANTGSRGPAGLRPPEGMRPEDRSSQSRASRPFSRR